jgi:hypothetical protein
MPDKICTPGTCDVPITEEASLRMTNPDNAAPAMHSDEETIAMAKTFQHRNHSQWKGVHTAGDHADLVLDRERMRFTYSIGGAFVLYAGQKLRDRAVGKCGVQ